MATPPSFVAPNAPAGTNLPTPDVVTRHWGIVQSIQSSSITVLVDGASVSNVPVRKGYVPTVGDICLLEVIGTGSVSQSRVFAVGVISNSTAPPAPPLTANPSGYMVANTEVVTATGVNTIHNGWASGSAVLKGGMTAASDRFTVPVTGVYTVGWQLIWENSGSPPSAGLYYTLLYKNGTTDGWPKGGSHTPGGANAFPWGVTTVPVSLNANDYVGVGIFQNSGGNQGVFGDAHCFFWAMLGSQ